MNRNDLEKGLRDVKYVHLTDTELDSYLNQQLDGIHQVRAESHLNRCLICEERLTVLKRERAAMDEQKISADDIAMAKRIMRQAGLRQELSDISPRESDEQPPAHDRLAKYLEQAVASWQAYFMQLKPERRARQESEEVWQWQSDDGALKAHAILEDTGDLTIRLSSNEMSLAGVKLGLRLSSINQETILRRASESELYAKFQVPLRKHPKDFTDISIEVI